MPIWLGSHSGGPAMTEYTVKEIGHQWIVYADRLSIAACADEASALKLIAEDSWQAEMDIVPVIETYNGYLIADRETGKWQFTNPPEHTRWSSDTNKAFGGRFKPLVK